MNKQFKEVYDDFEIEAIDCRRKINSINLQGADLIECLDKEINNFTIWREKFMIELGIWVGICH
jgi:hypothetical protein